MTENKSSKVQNKKRHEKEENQKRDIEIVNKCIKTFGNEL